MKRRAVDPRQAAIDAEEILAHIDKFGISCKDCSVPNAPRRTTSTTTRSKIPRMTLDLHGLRSEAATVRLRAAFDRCKATGIGELLVIHGYGKHSSPLDGPVLRKLVHDLLDNELCLSYKSYRMAPMKDGGEGATLVLLR